MDIGMNNGEQGLPPETLGTLATPVSYDLVKWAQEPNLSAAITNAVEPLKPTSSVAVEQVTLVAAETVSAIPSSDYPTPASLDDKTEFVWNEDEAGVDRYGALGERLAARGDLYRNTDYACGLLLASKSPNVPLRLIQEGRVLASVIVDRIRVKTIKDGKTKGTRVPSADLGTMLASEAFLQKFSPVDEVTRVPLYLHDFKLTSPGYNDGGRGNRVFYVGGLPRVEQAHEAIDNFLNVMDFATEADRTNTVAAALTVTLYNHFPGGKPLIAVTATKSHAGKDTVILFAAGTKRSTGVSYQATDWALERSIVGTVKNSPDTVVLNVENARLGTKQKCIASAFLERFLTDPEPTLFSTGTGNPLRRKNNLVIAISTNFGMLSTDLLNRSLPIHLQPIGNIADRAPAIGDPKLEYLPKNRKRIEAELLGMIENWKKAGMPLANVHHPFTQWAAVIGGILEVNGFTDFLANYNMRRTADDPLRRGLGLLGAAKPNEWHSAAEWARDAVDLGLRDVVPEADRGSEKGRERGMGVVLTNLCEETFHAETESERLEMRLRKSRRRFQAGEEPSTRYCFEVSDRGPLPEDTEETVANSGQSTDVALVQELKQRKVPRNAKE